MSLLRFEDIRLEFGEQVILRDAEFSIEPGERICLIGRNGAGKSTTLKLIMGEMEPDQGEIIPQAGMIVSQLRQNLPDGMELPVREVILSGLKEIDQLLHQYKEMSSQDLDKHGLAELEALHSKIDAHDGWHIDQRVDATMTDLNLPTDKKMSELSGGWRRRVALARALVQKPDLPSLFWRFSGPDDFHEHADGGPLCPYLHLDRLKSYPGGDVLCQCQGPVAAAGRGRGDQPIWRGRQLWGHDARGRDRHPGRRSGHLAFRWMGGLFRKFP